jgi:hypothetical protein
MNALPFVFQLRPLPSIDEELDWFFNQAESDMGASSNYQQALRIESPSARRTAEDYVEASAKYRRIRRWLKAIDDYQAGVLQAAYELRDWPVALFDELGRLTGIVVKLACSLDGPHGDRRFRQLVEMGRARWLVETHIPLRQNESLGRLRHKAQVLFMAANCAYGIARGRDS